MRFEMFGFSLMVTAALLSRNGLSSAFTFLPIPSRVPGFRYPLSMSSNAMAEKVLQAPKWPPEWPYSESDFARMDESDDGIFYDSPRLVSPIFICKSTRSKLLCLVEPSSKSNHS